MFGNWMARSDTRRANWSSHQNMEKGYNLFCSVEIKLSSNHARRSQNGSAKKSNSRVKFPHGVLLSNGVLDRSISLMKTPSCRVHKKKTINNLAMFFDILALCGFSHEIAVFVSFSLQSTKLATLSRHKNHLWIQSKHAISYHSSVDYQAPF